MARKPKLLSLVVCEQCGNQFRPKKGTKKRYCGYFCYWKSLDGKIPWNKGKHTGISPWLGKSFSQEHRQNLSKAKRGKTLSEEARKKLSLTQKRIGNHPPILTGENHPRWKGDKYSENYRERRKFQKIIRAKVFERDNYTCRMCGKRGGILHIDHIQPFADYVEGRFDMGNLRTLCVGCHYLITFKKEMPRDCKWGTSFMKGGD